MSEARLRALYEQHHGKVSDKWTIYLAEYARLFTPYIDQPVRLLEIGVQNGGSLEIWGKFFPEAQCIVGCDINPDCAKLIYEDPRLSVIVGDANTDKTAARILSVSNGFDLIIDDGSHTSGDIVRSFCCYFDRLVDGGLFIVEDLHCSYWRDFEGGLFDPAASIAFFKRLADVLSHQHWGVDLSRKHILRSFLERYGADISEEILQHIHSIEFINSMCVIRKNMPAENELGLRFIAGEDELVVGGHAGLHLTSPALVDERHNPWSVRALLPEEEAEAAKASIEQHELRARTYEHRLEQQSLEIARLTAVIEEKDRSIAQMTTVIGEKTKVVADLLVRIDEVFASTSWRVTKPLRWVGHQVLRAQRLRRRLSARLDAHGNTVSGAVGRVAEIYQTSGIQGLKDTVANIYQDTGVPAQMVPNSYATWVARFDTMDAAMRARMRARLATMRHQPLISVVMPTYNADPAWLKEAIESVRNQIYSRWELCIADDASTSAATRDVLAAYAGDPRIKIVFRPTNGHIVAASNSALEIARGEWIALMDHDDLLSEHALFWMADSINRHPHARLIYSDEDKIDSDGNRYDPHFKPDWNVDLFYSYNLFSHLGLFEIKLVREVGGFQPGMEGSQDWDLTLRCLEKIAQDQIAHVPRILYHWRSHAESTAQSGDAKPYAALAGERSLNEHFRRKQIRATAQFIGAGYRVRYELPEKLPLVSLIIPTRNSVDLVRQCISSILQKTDYSNYEIILVDNGSDDPAALKYFAELNESPNLRVVRDDCVFNYSAINNRAVAMAHGELIGLVNNDIEVINSNWLTEMVSIALQPGVGAVGARLWYPDRTLQHGGVVLGVGGVAGHAHKRLEQGRYGYFTRATLIQSFSAVTAACLIVRKDHYEQVGGLDEANLTVAFNDVDFCLRLKEAGLRNVWTPYAELFHHESASRGTDLTPEKQARFASEVGYMLERWGSLLHNDPAYSPNLTLNCEDFSYAWPPRTEVLSDCA